MSIESLFSDSEEEKEYKPKRSLVNHRLMLSRI